MVRGKEFLDSIRALAYLIHSSCWPCYLLSSPIWTSTRQCDWWSIIRTRGNQDLWDWCWRWSWICYSCYRWSTLNSINCERRCKRYLIPWSQRWTSWAYWSLEGIHQEKTSILFGDGYLPNHRVWKAKGAYWFRWSLVETQRVHHQCQTSWSQRLHS